jgi:ubiquinone/menaquinone biosynthesis C-methylase UbiE
MTEGDRPRFDPAIESYYDRAPEEARLAAGPGRLEEARTRELILRHAPAAPAVVLDVGGAAGAYAFWLAERGYDVRLIDAVPRLVDVARTRNAQARRPVVSCTVADARALPESDACADMVLMLGPLYHLVEAADRRTALTEAARALRAGGILVAAGISRFASALDGLSREVLRDADFARIVDRDLRDGRHENPTDRLGYFTTAYFHHPDELRREVADAGFEIDGRYGVEGPGWLLGDLADRWNDAERREVVLQVARKLESEPTVIGSSAHLIVVGRKPGVRPS